MKTRARFILPLPLLSKPALLAGLLAVGVACGPTTSHAQSQTGGVVYDQGGLPRCIPAANGKDALVFLWEKDAIYKKTVYAAAMSQMQFFVQDTDAYPYSCANWRSYVEGVDHTGGYLSALWIVPADQGQRGFSSGGNTYKWNDVVETRLGYVRLGATVAHPGANAVAFSRQYPIQDFTREYNRQITQAYGIGFAGDVYKEWLLNQPGNRDFLNQIEKEIQHSKTQGTASLAGQLKRYKILVAQGYMQSPSLNRMEPLISYLTRLGADITVMNADTLAPIAPNTAAFKMQIAHELSNGRQLIVISASKGAPEILTAISQIAVEDPRYVKQIRAVITMAGMIEGSFLVDWSDQFPINLLVKKILKIGSAEAKLPLTSTAGFFDMSSAVLAKQSEIYRKSLPDLHYYNFVGVLTGDGFAKDKDIRALQENISAPHVSLQGGNDGYIEYPGTRFPRGWGFNSRDVIFDSSHAILDGAYNGHSMQNERDLAISGIFSAVLNDAK